MNTHTLFRILLGFPLTGLILGCLAVPASYGQDIIKIPSNAGDTIEVAVSDFPVLNEQTRRAASAQAATRKGVFSELKARPIILAGEKQFFFCSSANRVRPKTDGIRAVGGLDCGPRKNIPCFWQHPFITVGFMNGTPEIKKVVSEVIAEWTTWANIAFVAADIATLPKDSVDIKVHFKQDGPHNSMVGIDAWLPMLRADPNEPTLNLGYLNPPLRYNDGSIIDDLRSVILHEFGHALGLFHEHQSPRGGIQWNREAVIKDLSGPPNEWDLRRIESNIFEALKDDWTKSTEYDPSSIMHYSFPATWTLNNVSMPQNYKLSETDKRFIAEIYPRRKLVIESDRYFRLTPVHRKRKLCLSLASGENGYFPFLTKCSNSSGAQLWSFTHVGDGDYRMTNYLTGKELSLTDDGLDYYAGFHRSGDYSGQKWTVTGLGPFKRLSSKSNGIGHSLNAFGEPGTRLTMKRTAHWINQLWELIPVEPGK